MPRSFSCHHKTGLRLADISELNGTAIANVAEFDGTAIDNVAEFDGLTIPSAAAFLLDTTYGSGAAVAYSTRKLKTGVTVAARIRRSGDDIEADVEFDSNNEISLTSPISNASSGTYTDLADFVDHTGTARDAFIDEWKDQSGSGNHAAQIHFGSQPKLYDATTGLITENGKAALEFDGSDDHFDITWTQSASNYSLHAVTKNTATNSFLFDSLTGRLVFDGRGGTRGVYYDGSWKGTMHSGTSQQLQSIYAIAPSSGQSYVDGSQINTGLSYTQTAIGGNTTLGTEVTQGAFDFDGTMQEWILYASGKTADRTSIEENINSEYLIYQPTDAPTSGLLSTHTGATAAYSVRQLSNKAVIALRVRRDSDDEERNIGFDSNGDLDTTAISDFCDTANGYVTRWWDQSTNGNHADQPVGGTGSNSNQPQIYNGAAVITENGKPALEFDGSNDKLDTPSTTWTTAGDMTVFTVADNDGTSNGRVWDGSGGTPRVFSRYMGGNDGMVIYGATTLNLYASSTNVQRLGTYLKNGSNADIFVNASSIANSSSAPNHDTGSSVASIGARQNNELWFNGRIQEIIHFPAAQTNTNRAAIETDIDNYYQIP